MNNFQSLKTYVFIDATNIIYGASDSGWRVDFEKLMHYLKTRFKALKVFYFAGLDQENLKQLKFYEKMQSFGYELRLVPVKKFKDGKKKADVDSRMTFEMMRMFKEYDQVIVFTGDGDFYWVLEYLQLTKCFVRLCAHRHSTARELRQLMAHNFTDIENLRHLLEQKKGKKNGTDAFKESAPRGYALNITKNKPNVKYQKRGRP